MVPYPVEPLTPVFTIGLETNSKPDAPTAPVADAPPHHRHLLAPASPHARGSATGIPSRAQRLTPVDSELLYSIRIPSGFCIRLSVLEYSELIFFSKYNFLPQNFRNTKSILHFGEVPPEYFFTAAPRPPYWVAPHADWITDLSCGYVPRQTHAAKLH